MLPLPARDRDDVAIKAFDSAAGDSSSTARKVTLYVLSFLPTYVDAEVRELMRRGIAVGIALPAPWPRSLLWDRITGFGRRAAPALDVHCTDFHQWLVAPRQALLRAAGRHLVPLLIRRPALVLRCARRGTLRHLIAAQALRAALDGARIGRVHSHFATDAAQIGSLLAALLRVPFSVTTHAHDIFVPRRAPAPRAGGSQTAPMGASLPGWVRHLLADAQQVLAISHFNRAHLQHVAGDDIARRVRVVHLGVDVDALPRWSPAGDVFTIACTASGLGEKKGVAVLLEACRLLGARGRRWRWRICGADPSGERLAELRERVCALGLGAQIELPGALAYEDALDVVARANVFVHPSIRSGSGDMDGIPVSLLEAMGMGVPVIASHLSGIPELVDDGQSGVLVRPGDALALAAAIERLAEEPRRAAALGRAARGRVRESFSLPRSVDGLLDAWNAGAPGQESRGAVEVRR